MKTTFIKRLPDLRCDVVRKSVTPKNEQDVCQWCGGRPAGRLKNTLYIYGVWPDDKAHVRWYDKRFCAHTCHKNYYGLDY